MADSEERLPAIVVGSVGGASSVMFTHPIDTMKVRAQAGKPPVGLNVASLYKGVSTPLVTVSAQWAMLYSGNRFGQQLYSSLYPDETDGTTWCWQRSLLGGIFSGFFCSVAASASRMQLTE